MLRTRAIFAASYTKGSQGLRSREGKHAETICEESMRQQRGPVDTRKAQRDALRQPGAPSSGYPYTPSTPLNVELLTPEKPFGGCPNPCQSTRIRFVLFRYVGVEIWCCRRGRSRRLATAKGKQGLDIEEGSTEATKTGMRQYRRKLTRLSRCLQSQLGALATDYLWYARCPATLLASREAGGKCPRTYSDSHLNVHCPNAWCWRSDVVRTFAASNTRAARGSNSEKQSTGASNLGTCM
jgi:hypothetical protein